MIYGFFFGGVGVGVTHEALLIPQIHTLFFFLLF